MVHLGVAMKAEKKQFFMGISRAKDLFFEVATIPEGEEDPVINFDQFLHLIAMILTESNAEAAKKDKPVMEIPSKSDLHALFCSMDTNDSDTIDEYEFIGLYKAVKDGHVKGIASASYSFYSRPRQLMKWGDHDYHPNTDWQDLFFDLLFVGGAFQSGNFLVNGLIANDKHMFEAVVWSFCLFTTLAQHWLMKILLGSRFSHTSMFHYLVDNVEFILLAFAMWHIPASPLYVKIEKDDASYSSYGNDDGARRLAANAAGYSSEDYDRYSCLDQLKYNINGRTGGFSLSLCLVHLLYLFKWLEIYFDSESSVGAVALAKYQAGGYAACFLILFAAYFIAKVDDYQVYVTWVWVASNCAYLASLYLWVFFMRVKKKAGRLDLAGVPMSTNYFIQRVGEFCMLIIGESVLSLLALSVEPEYENYLMFGASAIIACNLYFHHFSTYPPDRSQHVLHDGTFDFAGCCYAVALIYLWPFCVVHIGVCLKALLYKAAWTEPLTFTNWAIAVGICVEYILINFFVFIHDKSRGKENRWKPFATNESMAEFFENLILKGLSMVLVLAFAGFGLRPFNMVMLCCVGLLVQSVLVLFLHRKVDDDKDEELEIAERDFLYQHAKLHPQHQRKSSIALYAINTFSRMRSVTREAIKKNTINSSVSPARGYSSRGYSDVEDDCEMKKENDKQDQADEGKGAASSSSSSSSPGNHLGTMPTGSSSSDVSFDDVKVMNNCEAQEDLENGSVSSSASKKQNLTSLEVEEGGSDNDRAHGGGGGESSKEDQIHELKNVSKSPVKAPMLSPNSAKKAWSTNFDTASL